MPYIQIVLTAFSLSAVAGGTWTVERVMDRYGRIPVSEESAILPGAEAEEEAPEESRLLY